MILVLKKTNCRIQIRESEDTRYIRRIMILLFVQLLNTI